jgi:hypothetical protein
MDETKTERTYSQKEKTGKHTKVALAAGICVVFILPRASP